MAELENPEVMGKVMRYLSSVLQRIAEDNDVKGMFRAQKVSVFDGLTKPGISIGGYLERIFQYANCSPSCLVVAYIYMDRFAQMQPLLPLHSFNVHRLIISSVLVSAKFLDDVYYDNAFYAKIGGISTKEMNLLEVDFLFGVGFQLNVSPTTFDSYCCHIRKEMLLESPPLHLHFFPSKSDIVRALNPHCFIDQEDDSSLPQQHQLAV